MTDRDSPSSEEDRQCSKCELSVAPLVDAEELDWTDHDEICGRCIHEHSKQYGHRPRHKTAAQERKEWQQAAEHVRNGSGWPR